MVVLSTCHDIPPLRQTLPRLVHEFGTRRCLQSWRCSGAPVSLGAIAARRGRVGWSPGIKLRRSTRAGLTPSAPRIQPSGPHSALPNRASSGSGPHFSLSSSTPRAAHHAGFFHFASIARAPQTHRYPTPCSRELAPKQGRTHGWSCHHPPSIRGTRPPTSAWRGVHFRQVAWQETPPAHESGDGFTFQR